jgi:hypothetical protein
VKLYLRILFSIFAIGALTHCSAAGLSGAVPSNGVRQTQAIASSSTPSFSDAIGQKLTAAQLDAYIDPSVTGSDRVLARQLLGVMPPGIRGDFVYIKGDGTMMSNRPSVLKGAKLNFRFGKPSSVATSDTRKTMAVVAPPATTNTGPYARQYSALGVNAAFGYATIDCNDDYLYESDNGPSASDYGDMYVGGMGEPNGNGTGIDAGIQMSPLDSIQPFLNISAEGGYQALQYYPSTHYNCGGNGVGMIYGSLPEPYFVGFFATGVPPYPAETYSQPPATVVWSSPAWTFYLKAASFVDPGTDSTGAPTDCQTCITKRMTSIAMATGASLYNSDACFGACNGYIGERWDQVEMGQIVLPCQTAPPSGYPFVCTIQYQTNGSWLGGYQVYPDTNVVETNEYTPNEANEGIDLSQDDQAQGATRRPVGVALGPLGPYIPTPAPTPTYVPKPPCSAAVRSGAAVRAVVSPDVTCPL